MSQSESDKNGLGQSETFGEMKKEALRVHYTNATEKLLRENPHLTAEQIAKRLGIAKTTLLMYLDQRPQIEKGKEMSFTKLLGLTGIGLGTAGILSDANNFEKLSGFIENEVLSNKVFVGLSAGMWLFWEKFIVPRVEDVKNDKSELEVFTDLMKSPVVQTVVGAWIGSFTIPILIDMIGTWIGGFVDTISNAINDIVPDIESPVETLEDFNSYETEDCVYPYSKQDVWDGLSKAEKWVMRGTDTKQFKLLYARKKADWITKNCE